MRHSLPQRAAILFLTLLSAATAAAQNALDELMSTVGQLTTGAASPEVREKFRTALQNYLAKRAEAKKRQQNNPYPPSPRDLCQ